MTHDQAEPLLIDLAYGELPPDEARDVEGHAARCATCTAEMERLVTARRLAARLADDPAPARGVEELRAAARRAVAPAPTPRRTRPRVYTIAASAVVLAVVAGVTLRLSGDSSPVAVRDAGPEVQEAEPSRSAPAPSRPASPRSSVRAPASPPAALDAPREQSVPAPRSASPHASAAAAPEPSAASRPEPPPALPPLASAAKRPDAQGASRSTAAEARDASEAEPQSVVEDVERRSAGGQLRQEARRVVCGGAAIERVAFLDGPAVVKVTVRDDTGVVAEGWYDAAGRLRAIRRGGAAIIPFRGAEGAGGETPSGEVLPARAPMVADLTRCAW